MADHKKQHYVPQFFLDRFSDQNQVYLYNLRKYCFVGRVSYKSQCYEDYFYGEDGQLEGRLAKWEAGWDKRLQEVFAPINPIFSHDGIKALRRFVVYQYLRSKAISIIRREQQIEINKILKGMYRNQQPDGIDLPEEYDFFPPKTLKENVRLCVQDAEIRWSCIQDLDILTVSYKTQREFIVTDNPIVLINPLLPEGASGLIIAGLIVFTPVSPHQLLVFYDRKIYTGNKALCLTSNDENEILKINEFLIESADKVAMGKSEETMDFLAGNSERYKVIRDKYFESNLINHLGGNKQALLQVTPRKHHLKHELSFAKIPESIKGLHLELLHLFSRKGSHKEFERLRSIEDMAHNPLPLEDVSPQIRESFMQRYNDRELYSQAVEFVLKYWQS